MKSRKKLFAAVLASALIGAGCSSPSVIKEGYDLSRIKQIGVLKFESKFPAVSGVEDLFAKHLMLEGFGVVERSMLEQLLKEQRIGLEGLLLPASAKAVGGILGVDALMMGQVVSFTPDRKDVSLIITTNKYEEPVFRKVRKRRDDGSYLEVQEQVGTKVRYENVRVPHVYTIYAQVGIVAKLVDVETGEIVWVGSYTNEGINTLIALESTVDFLVGKLVSQWPRH